MFSLKYTNFIIPIQLARNSCKIACIYFFVKVHKRACIVSRYAALLPTLNTQKTDVFWGSAGFVLFWKVAKWVSQRYFCQAKASDFSPDCFTGKFSCYVTASAASYYLVHNFSSLSNALVLVLSVNQGFSARNWSQQRSSFYRFFGFKAFIISLRCEIAVVFSVSHVPSQRECDVDVHAFEIETLKYFVRVRSSSACWLESVVLWLLSTANILARSYH